LLCTKPPLATRIAPHISPPTAVSRQGERENLGLFTLGQRLGTPTTTLALRLAGDDANETGNLAAQRPFGDAARGEPLRPRPLAGDLEIAAHDRSHAPR
jgi:hypothetical protein